MLRTGVIDGIVSSLKKMEQKLRDHSATKQAEAEAAAKKSNDAAAERQRADKIADNLARLLGE